MLDALLLFDSAHLQHVVVQPWRQGSAILINRQALNAFADRLIKEFLPERSFLLTGKARIRLAAGAGSAYLGGRRGGIGAFG